MHRSVLGLSACAASFLGMLNSSLLERSQSILRRFMDDFQIVVFLTDQASPEQTEGVRQKLNGLPQTREVRFVPKDRALADLRRANRARGAELLLLGENPLPQSFILKTNPPILSSAISELARLIGSLPGVADVAFKEEQIAAIENWNLTKQLLHIGWLTCWTILLALFFGLFSWLLSQGAIHEFSWGGAVATALLGSLAGLSIFWALTHPWFKPVGIHWAQNAFLGLLASCNVESISLVRKVANPT